MKLKRLYELAVQNGMAQDPRGIKAAKKDLEKNERAYEKLDPSKKEYFDKESLKNPYDDTRILYGDPDKEIKRIMVGVDVEVGEILLADRLSSGKKKIDLLMAHHPEGKALAGLYKVMGIQADILRNAGVSINVAEDLTKGRSAEVERGLLPINHTRSVDAAKALGMPLICCHTVADNCVASYLQKLMDKKKPDTVGDVMDILYTIPEYKDSASNNAGPKLIKGDNSNTAGKIFVDMTGGTEGSRDIFPKLSQAGVGTLICMHLSEAHFKKAKAESMNIIIAGHISSDNIGLNIMLDEILKGTKIEIVPCSGFKRIKR